MSCLWKVPGLLSKIQYVPHLSEKVGPPRGYSGCYQVKLVEGKE
jgi:hypothetical protein